MSDTDTTINPEQPANEGCAPVPCSLSERVAAAVNAIPQDQLNEAMAWTAEYHRQLRARMPGHICNFHRAMDGTCFVCGENVKCPPTGDTEGR